MRRSDIVAEARTLVGTPFQHQGRTPGVGLDCGGVIVHLLRFMGINYDVAGYGRLPEGLRLIEVCDEALVRIRPSVFKPGDVIALRLLREPQHLALVTDYGILHAWQRIWTPAKVCETILTADWRQRIAAAWQFPGVTDG